LWVCKYVLLALSLPAQPIIRWIWICYPLGRDCLDDHQSEKAGNEKH